MKLSDNGEHMRRSKMKHAERLRLIVDTLPYETRVAMLEGLGQYDIIAGAYSNRDGGVCPMLAAHRCGGRTDLRSFARAWDRFTGAGRARRASERELRTLAAQLEASLWKEDQALHAHRADIERLTPSRPEPQEPRVDSLVRHGRHKRPQVRVAEPADRRDAWLLPFRDLEQYARALERAMAEDDDVSGELAPEELLVS
jgi:hypothetical protein